MSIPLVQSSKAALSRSDKDKTWSVASPCQYSEYFGPEGNRPLLGFKPNIPQQEEGTRIDPPPSFPWATGTIRDATVAAEPPLDPPEVRFKSHGLLQEPNIFGSVTKVIPYSGVLVLPRIMSPAFLYRDINR